MAVVPERGLKLSRKELRAISRWEGEGGSLDDILILKDETREARCYRSQLYLALRTRVVRRW
jgi:hypothetical protein